MLNKIQDELKNAQLARDGAKTSTLRLLLSELTYAKVAKGGDLTDQDVLAVIQREIKKRKEAAEGFRQGDREQEALKEEDEARILREYLPEQMSIEELTKVIESSINEVGANSIKDMGKVMGTVKAKVGQSADGSTISEIVKNKLEKI